MTTREWLLLVGIVLVAVVAVWPSPSEPDERRGIVIHRIDSLQATRPHDMARLEELQARHQTAAGAAARFQDSALKERVRADSLATVARTTKATAEQWEAAYLARTAEAVQLRAANDSLTEVVTTDSSRILLLSTRLLATEQALQLAAPFIKHPDACRLIGPIPCPTRRQAFVLGVATGGVLTAGLRISF